MLTQHVKRLIKLPWQLVKRLYVKPLLETLIDFGNLSLSLKLLAVLGYLSVAALLGLALLFDLFGDRMAAVTYETSGGAQQTPFVVMIVSSLALVLGWAYILTGATDCKLRIFLPIVLLFGLQLFLMVPTGNALWIWVCTAPTMVIFLVLAYLLTQKRRLWRDFPLLEFSFWGCVFLAFSALFWLFQETNESVAGYLNASLGGLNLLTWPFWVVSGLTMVDLVVSIARAMIRLLRRLFPGNFLRALSVFLIATRPAVGILALILAPNSADLGPEDSLFFDAVLSIPLILLMGIMILCRRWNARNALVILGLSLASPIFILGAVMALKGFNIGDPLELTMQGLGISTSQLIFVALMAYNVFNLGSAFANIEGRVMPRSGRIHLLFGFALLMTSTTIFFINSRDVSSGELGGMVYDTIDQLFALSLVFLGIPFLIWMALRRPEKLAGKETEFEERKPLLVWLERIPLLAWAVASVVAVILFTCVAVVVVFILTNA